MDDETDVQFVEESSEWIDVHHDSSNSSSFLDQSNMADSSDYLDESLDSTRSLRSSRRRVQKHSAVVLSSQRMKKITSHSRSNDSNVNPAELAQIVEESEEEELQERDDHNQKDDSRDIHHHPNSPNKPPTLATSLLNKISPTSKKSPQLHPSVKSKPKVSETQAAIMILEWWNQKKKNRLLKFTQHGQWSFHVANKVFSLILGHRIRKIFQSAEIQKLISAQRDLRHVLQELLEQSIKEPKVNSPKSNRSIQTIPQTIDYWLTYLQKLQSSQSVLPSSDQVFAKSLIKQLLAEREKLIKSLHQDSQWISYPKPGYRLFNRSRFMKKATVAPASASKGVIGSPSRPLRSSALQKKKVQDTPPHVKAAIEPAALQAKAMKKSLKVNHLSNAGGKREDEVEVSGAVTSELHLLENSSLLGNPDERPLTGSGIGKMEGGRATTKPTRKGNTNTTTSLFKVQSALEESKESGSISSNRSSESGSRPSTNKSLNNPRASNTSVATSQTVVRKRSGDGGHIQLEIISAEKLIPAKKGAAKEGNPVADRKPCVKVVFYLPTSSTSSSAPSAPKSPGHGSNNASDNGLKKVFQQSRDYNILTLNPKFNCSFTINLPFSKQVLRNTIERQQWAHLFDGSSTNPGEDDSGYLSDSEYEVIVKAMLQYWSSGIIEIEIYDGERFNEEIFMGRIQLLVTSFLPLIRKFHELEMKGSYTLEKAKPKDRVSGSVLLAAYFHVPEKKYIEEQIFQLLTTMKYQEMEQHIAGNNSNNNRRSTLTVATKASTANSVKSRKAPASSFSAGEDSSFNNFSSADDGGNESSSSEIYRGNRRLSQVPNSQVVSDHRRASTGGGSGNLPLRSALSMKNIVNSEDDRPVTAPALSHHRKTRQSIVAKVPMPGKTPPASDSSTNNNISAHMKSLAHKKIPSQGDLGDILNAPIQDDSVNIKLPDNKPVSQFASAGPSATSGSHIKSPNSIYFRSPFTPSPTQQLQQLDSGHSSASSASKPYRSYHRRVSSVDLTNTPPPISSLDEVRGSNIPVSAIVSHEVAVESTMNKRLFLEGMSKQLSGLEALVQQTSTTTVNDQALAQNLSKKLHHRNVSQVMDLTESGVTSTTKATAQENHSISSVPHHQTKSAAEEAPKSPIRLPSGYQPRLSNSPSSYGTTAGAGGANKSQYAGRASLAKGLNDLKSQVNQTVQNLEKFLVDIPVLEDPEENGNHHLFSSDEEEEDRSIHKYQQNIATKQEKHSPSHPQQKNPKSIMEHHPNKYKQQQTPPSATSKGISKATPSPTKIPTTAGSRTGQPDSAGRDRSFPSHHYYEDDAYDSDYDRLYEEDEDHQFRKHRSFGKKGSPTKPVTSSSSPSKSVPASASRRKTTISSDSDDDDDSFQEEKYRIQAKGVKDATSQQQMEEDEEESRQKKRISTRDLANQHAFKYHSPGSPTKQQASPNTGKVPLPFPIPSTEIISASRSASNLSPTLSPAKLDKGTPAKSSITSPTAATSTSKTAGAMSRSTSKDQSISKAEKGLPIDQLRSPTHSLDYSINSNTPSVPTRSSSRLYESKSLSHSDIEELNQRVKLLSQLSYSSTDGEGGMSNKGLFSPKSISRDESVMSNITSGSGSRNAQKRQVPAPPSPSQSQVSRSPTKESVTSQTKVHVEDRYVENEHVSTSSPKKDGVASRPLASSSVTSPKGNLKSPKGEKQKPPQPPPPAPRSLQLAQPSPNQSFNMKKNAGLNSPSQIPSLRNQRNKRTENQLSSPPTKPQSHK